MDYVVHYDGSGRPSDRPRQTTHPSTGATGGGGGGGHDDKQAQGPAEQKGWDLPALFATLQALYAADDDIANKPAAGFVHRAVLFLGRSYALPLVPDAAQRAALRPLLESDRFFLDVLYTYAVKEDSSSRKRMKGGEEASEVEVVDLEAESEEEEEQEEKEEAAAAAAGAAMAEGKEERGAAAGPPPPPLPARPSLQAPAIWKALTAEYGERDLCGRPQGDYFFDVPHGPLGVSRLLLRAQLLLAHPVQRDGQVCMYGDVRGKWGWVWELFKADGCNAHDDFGRT